MRKVVIIHEFNKVGVPDFDKISEWAEINR